MQTIRLEQAVPDQLGWVGELKTGPNTNMNKLSCLLYSNTLLTHNKACIKKLEMQLSLFISLS